jgi:hypothetical protein
MKALKVAMRDFSKAQEAYHENVPLPPYKVWDKAPTWEENKEMNCDSKFSMYSEENKAWYAGFLEKVGFMQNIFDNAKQTTDFSSNAKWNIVMNLLK